MKQRGRGNGAQGTVAARPPPPVDFDEARRTVWNEIVQAMPAGWFTPGNLPLLEAFVHRRQCVRILEKTVQEELALPATKRNMLIMIETARFLRQEIGAMKVLATSLALTQASQGTGYKKPKPEPKGMAWDTEEEDTQ